MVFTPTAPSTESVRCLIMLIFCFRAAQVIVRWFHSQQPVVIYACSVNTSKAGYLLLRAKANGPLVSSPHSPIVTSSLYENSCGDMITIASPPPGKLQLYIVDYFVCWQAEIWIWLLLKALGLTFGKDENSLSGGGFALHSCPMLTSPGSPVCERVFSLTPVGLATSFLPLLPSNNCSHSVFEHKHTLLVVSLQLSVCACVCVCVLSNRCESGEWNPSPFSAESCYDALLENGRISP